MKATPFGPFGSFDSIDATGFATNTYARWFDHAHGTKRKTQRACFALMTRALIGLREAAASTDAVSALRQQTDVVRFREV